MHITFFVNFYEIFSTNLKSAQNSAVFDTHIIYFKRKCFFAFLAPFANFKANRGGSTAQKNKNIFYKCVLEFNLATINSL